VPTLRTDSICARLARVVAGSTAWLLMLAACSAGEPTASASLLAAPSPAATATATASASPTPTPPAAIEVETLRPVDGFTFEPASGLDDFISAAERSIGEDDSVRILVAGDTSRDGQRASAIAFIVRASDSQMENDRFRAILEDMASAFGAEPQVGLGGQAFVIEGDDLTVAMSAWGSNSDGTATLFLAVVGDSGFVEAVTLAVLNSEP
jgi:hypothetical protein